MIKGKKEIKEQKKEYKEKREEIDRVIEKHLKELQGITASQVYFPENSLYPVREKILQVEKLRGMKEGVLRILNFNLEKGKILEIKAIEEKEFLRLKERIDKKISSFKSLGGLSSTITVLKEERKKEELKIYYREFFKVLNRFLSS